MSARHPRLVPLALVGAVLGALLACTPTLDPPISAAHDSSSAEASVPQGGGIMHLSSFADIRSLDPASLSDGLVPEMLEAIYAGLVDFDDAGNVVPDLAERMETLDGGKLYRFTLRRGVKLHDGAELTADDVVRSIERALHPSTPNSYTSFFSSIAGYEAYTKERTPHLEGVRARGTYEVDIALSAIDVTFLSALALQVTRPVCQSGGTRFAASFVPCGAGPFRLAPDGWQRGRELRLLRHDGYFARSRVHLDGITWAFKVNVKTELFKFMNGEIDMLRDFGAVDAQRLLADPRWRALGAYEPEKQMGGEVLNTEVAPFDNVEIRRAIASAIHRDHLALARSTNLRASGNPLPRVAGALADRACQTYDYPAALEHMRRAGFAYDPVTKRGGYPHAIPYVAYRQGVGAELVQLVAQDLAKIGIALDVRVVSYPAYLALSQRRHGTAMSPYGWLLEFPEPQSLLFPLFHSKSMAEDDSNNSAFYANAEVDAALDAAKHEPDEAVRRAHYERVVDRVCSDAPWAFTYGYRFYDVRQPYVRGYVPHPMWAHHVSFAWLDREPPGASKHARATLVAPSMGVVAR